MPHDKNGQVLSIGDTVLIEAKVKNVYTGDEYCNVELETVEVMYPGENKSGITLNAKQVTKKAAEAVAQ